MTVLTSYLNEGKGCTAKGKRMLWMLVFCCFTLFVSGQTTGYQGKRLMFKTEVVSPISERGINLGIEYVILRNLVLGLDFSLTGKQYTQRLISYRDIHGEYPPIRASIRDMQVGITGQYFLNTALPAPKGSYVFGKYYIGQADIFAVEHIKPEGEADFLQGFEISNIPSQQFDLGFGYQEVFFGFLLLDLDIGVSAASLFLNTKNDVLVSQKNIVTDFTDRHGPNIFSAGRWRNTPGGIGLSIHLKIGILLF